MARTAIPYSNWAPNSDLTDPAGTALNPGPSNGHTIETAEPELTVLRVTTNADGGGDITVRAGLGTGFASGRGDLVVAVADDETRWIGPFESATYINSDGTLLVDVATGVAGTLTAFRLPRHD